MTPTADVRFTRIYETHYADILAYCARRVNRTWAEDVTNEVFVVLWRRIDRFDDERPLPWLYSVAYRTIANRRRSMQRKVRLVERLRGVRQASAEAAEDVVVRRERDRVVIDAMSRLSATDQEVLRLAAWEELTAPLIAEVMRCSVAAAEQRIYRAKKRLGRALPASFNPVVLNPLPIEETGGHT